MKTQRTVFATRAISCFIAIFSFGSFAAGATNSTGEAKVGDHFRVIPAADGTNEVTLVGNGLNYQDTNGAWIQSIPVVQSFPNAIVCTGATYRVILATNLNSSGSVDLELPADPATGNRDRMVSHPIGLAFYDPDSGATVLLAALKDCAGQIVSNQVIFADAFAHSNGIQASVTYTYGVGHFHQDITLTTRPSVTPADFSMGPDARLEMLTEFEQSPEPEIVENTVSTGTRATANSVTALVDAEPAVTDQTLNYGTMRMGKGRAFSTSAASPMNTLTVTKQLISVANQNFLTEDVPWNQAADALQNLPPSSAETNSVSQVSVRRTMPRQQLIAQLSARGSKPVAKSVQSFKERLAEVQRLAPLKIASLNPQLSALNSLSGFVLDYELVQTCNDITFQNGHTYLIGDYVQIFYVTIQSGAVIKFSGGDLEPMYYLECPSSGPKAVMTDINDDSVGATISSSVGHFRGYYTFTPLNLSGLDGYMAYVHNLDFRFMGYGIVAPTIEGNGCYVYDNWFFKCQYGLSGTVDFVVGPSSCEFCEVDTPFPEDLYPYDVTYCSASVDRNGNGLPDNWEFDRYGSLSQTAGGDYDGDGISNQQDYSSGPSHKLELFTPLK